MVTLSCHSRWSESPLWRGKKLFEGGPLGNFAFLGLAAVSAGIQVLVEETADVKLVEGIGFGLFRNFFGLRLEEGFVAVVVRLGGLFALLFQDGVCDHLLVDHFAQFEPVQRQNADHLDEAGRQNLLLGNSEVEFESLPGHGCSR